MYILTYTIRTNKLIDIHWAGRMPLRESGKPASDIFIGWFCPNGINNQTIASQKLKFVAPVRPMAFASHYYHTAQRTCKITRGESMNANRQMLPR